MNLLKKAAVCFAATSMVMAPVAASAAPAVGSALAVSTVDDQSELEGNTGWIVMALAALGIIVSIVLLTDGNDNDNPTSP